MTYIKHTFGDKLSYKGLQGQGETQRFVSLTAQPRPEELCKEREGRAIEGNTKTTEPLLQV